VAFVLCFSSLTCATSVSFASSVSTITSFANHSPSQIHPKHSPSPSNVTIPSFSHPRALLTFPHPTATNSNFNLTLPRGNSASTDTPPPLTTTHAYARRSSEFHGPNERPRTSKYAGKHVRTHTTNKGAHLFPGTQTNPRPRTREAEIMGASGWNVSH
jgi:hypothetical protein